VQELGGLVFAYMGPLPAPLLPPWDLFVWPNAVRQIGTAQLNCNWLQCQENTGDPTHGVWLHGYLTQYQLEQMGETERLADFGDDFTRSGVGIKGLYANPTPYGMEKGIEYSRELGAERDYSSRHSTVIFPFYTEQSAGGSPWSEFQIRVPIDDTHTYHINYNCYAAPPGVQAPEQTSVPYYEVPIWDEHGEPILDCTLNQDFIGWWAQGELTDRSIEKLGRTDTPVIFLRRQLDQQIRIVEDGGDPINVFRDCANAPEILFGGGDPAVEWVSEDWASRPIRQARNNRLNYHTGGSVWDSDRYGPAIPLVAELHRRIESARLEAQSVR
jgi:5,5'-dehydrodivanillate O-demethylase